MGWVIEDDLTAFAPAVLPWLEREPVLNNVLYTVIGSRYAGEQPVEHGALWARLVGDHGEVRAVALRTPPHPMIVSALSPADAESLAAAVAGHELSGVSGPTSAVRALLAAWTGPKPELSMAQRIYQLDTVKPPVGVPGALRPATADDEALAVAWTLGFSRDTGGPADTSATDATRVRLAANRLWIWDVDGTPVSIACNMASVAGVTRVGLVYTPPELRRHGYASACVAALSQVLLDRGAKACMLYTDLGNPTSNAIYQAIGYRPVTDAELWRFP